jgi:hypothetical protein
MWQVGNGSISVSCRSKLIDFDLFSNVSIWLPYTNVYLYVLQSISEQPLSYDKICLSWLFLSISLSSASTQRFIWYFLIIFQQSSVNSSQFNLFLTYRLSEYDRTWQKRRSATWYTCSFWLAEIQITSSQKPHIELDEMLQERNVPWPTFVYAVSLTT